MASNKMENFSLQETERLLPENEQVAIALHPRKIGRLLQQVFGPEIRETTACEDHSPATSWIPSTNQVITA